MADHIHRAEYWYTHVPDRAGEAWRVTHELHQAGVNLLAFLAFPSPGHGAQVDLVPAEKDPFLAACRKAGVKLVGPKTCFLVAGDERPGAVAGLLARLADAKINVTALAGACAGAGHYGAILWVKPEAVEATARALGI